mgnify:CR=1 FL=1
MFLGDQFTVRLVIEGVSLSKSLASFHFDGNKLSSAACATIYKVFRHPPRKDDQSNIVMGDENDSSTELSEIDLLLTPEGEAEVPNKPRASKPKHSKLGTATHDEGLIEANISALVKAESMVV